MEPKEYCITRIEGEYAYLREPNSTVEVFVALALLPIGADVGTWLHYEPLQGYTVIRKEE